MRAITESRCCPSGKHDSSCSSRSCSALRRCSNVWGSDRLRIFRPRWLQPRAVGPALDLLDDLLMARTPRFGRLGLFGKLTGYPAFFRHVLFSLSSERMRDRQSCFNNNLLISLIIFTNLTIFPTLVELAPNSFVEQTTQLTHFA